ncbi:MAG: sigma-70 family RNA polymerase sigma factor [Vampirovibrionales bacterium]|nr:sigma-70 family RNA polymerase sigma factor [Vampirovibrionales bacterium]
MSQFIPLVERVAQAEYRRIPRHMVDYEELVSIGAMAIQVLIKNKTPEAIAKLNTSYIATATRWAIRNELRTRYKWYTLKLANAGDEGTTETEEGAQQDANGKEGDAAKTPGQPAENAVREAVYESILSIDGITSGEDGESSHDVIRDHSATPEERLEIVELGRAIKQAIENLPEKERQIMEQRFYKNMQVKDIATNVGLSSSRVTRIIQSCILTVRDYLRETDHLV